MVFSTTGAGILALEDIRELLAGDSFLLLQVVRAISCSLKRFSLSVKCTLIFPLQQYA